MAFIYPEAIAECRRNHDAARKIGFKPEQSDSQNARELMLFPRGRVVWGAIAKANAALYQAGTISARGCVVFSFDPDFDTRCGNLASIASLVFALHGAQPADPSLKRFTAIVSDDQYTPKNQLVPAALSQGSKIHYEELYIYRERLPTACLVDRLLPLIADPAQPSSIMLLPLRFWSASLSRYWQSKSRANPAAPVVQTSITFDIFMTDPVVITPRTARQLRQIIAQQKLKQPFLKVGEEHGLYSMDLVEYSANAKSQFSYGSEGIALLIDPKCARNLMGLEIDYLESSQQSGFKFNKRND